MVASNFLHYTHRRPTLRLQRLRRLHHFREPEVRNLDARIVRLAPEQQILRLKIPVRHPPLVTIIHGLQKYLARHPRLLLVVIALLYDPVEELAAVHGLHDKVVGVGLLKEVIEADYVFAAAEGREDCDLVPECGDVLLLELGTLNAFDGVLLGGGALMRAGTDGGEGSLSELWAVYIVEMDEEGNEMSYSRDGIFSKRSVTLNETTLMTLCAY